MPYLTTTYVTKKNTKQYTLKVRLTLLDKGFADTYQDIRGQEFPYGDKNCQFLTTPNQYITLYVGHSVVA